MKKVLLPLICILAVATYYLFTGDEKTIEATDEDVQKTEERKTESSSEDDKTTMAKANNNDDQSTSNKSEDKSPTKRKGKVIGQFMVGEKSYPLVRGEVVMGVGVGSEPHQLGVDMDGGGNGPGAFAFASSGEILISDTANSRISTYRNGELEEVVSFGDRHLKGVSSHDGNLYALVTDKDDYTKVNIETYSMDGQLVSKNKISFELDNLNTQRIEANDKGVMLIGHDNKTTFFGKDGSAVQSFGVPSKDGKESVDTIIDDDGNAVVTIRNADGSPKSAYVEKGPIGEHRATYTLNDGGHVQVYGTDPSANETNADDPKFLFVRVNKEGKVTARAAVSMEGTVVTDHDVVVDAETGQPTIMQGSEKEQKLVTLDLVPETTN